MDRLIVGTIIRPHGVRGAMKIDPLTDDVARFKKLKEVYIKNIKYTVKCAQVSNREVYLTLNELIDRNAVEPLRNLDIEIDRKDAIVPKNGSYFVVDVIGCDVYFGDENIGKIKDVLQNGSADVYVMEATNKKEIMFPALKRVVEKVDIENKKIFLNKEAFGEVAVYED